MVTGDGVRPKRVAQTIREHLAGSISRELSDPAVASLSITRVELSPDLSTARVWVRLFVGDDDPKARSRATTALERARGRLRRGLGPRLKLKRVPQLVFAYDTGHDASMRVEQLLDEIHRERGEGEPPASGD